MTLVNSQVVRGQMSPYGQPQPQQQPALTLDQIRAAIRGEMETKAKQEAAASREVGFRDFLASEIRGRAVDSKVFGDLEPSSLARLLTRSTACGKRAASVLTRLGRWFLRSLRTSWIRPRTRSRSSGLPRRWGLSNVLTSRSGFRPRQRTA